MTTKFIHLRNHTEYSICSGTIKIKKVVKYLVENNIPAFAMTDTHGMFGALEFSLAASKEGIQPIIGCEAVLNINGLLFNENKKFFSSNEEDKNFCKIVILAQTDQGYLNLISLLSNSYLERKNNIKPNILFKNLKEKNEGLIILSGSIDGCFEKLLLNNQNDKAEEIIKIFKDIFKDRFYVELQRHGLEKEIKIEKKSIELAHKYDIQLVATNDCYFLKKSMYEAQDILSCISDARYITETNRPRLTPEHYFKTEDEMVELFADIPEAVENTINIANRISTMSYARKSTLPHFPITDKLTLQEKQEYIYWVFPDYILEDNSVLRIKNENEKNKNCDIIKINFNEAVELIRFSREGLKERLKKKFILENITDENIKTEINERYFKQMQYELGIIIQMDFPGYFLIVSDFIVWSKTHDVPIGPGRGSGAGSVVAWSMKITDLDPIKFSLFFERFLNPERISMPDFDIDLCQRGRARTIEYVKNKYGPEMVAQIITFGKLQAKAVIKDVGRVLQMGYSEVDKISKMIPFNAELEDALNMDEDLQKQRKENEQIDKLLTISLQLEGLNRHSSVHAAGVVIGDKPLELICPLYSDGQSDMPVVQYSMKYAEQVGLVKFDFLGLKTLTIIRDTLEYIKNIRNIDINISDIDLNDQEIYKMLRKADSIAVFQIESTGMRGMLKQIKPDNIEDIIALISLYRPGPMDSIPTYIKRKHGIEEVKYPDPRLEKILKDTYGIIIYQEQVMDIAKTLAGYTLGGADILRRAMGKKIKEEMDKQRGVFVEGCKNANNIEPIKANEIFDLLAKFAEYGFNKAHAAAYAMISFQTAYLKKYYPVEFMVANMNIEINDSDKINFYLEDVKKHNIKILPPDINISQDYFITELIDIVDKKDKTVEKYYNDKELSIRYSLGGIKGIGTDMIAELLKNRKQNGNFKNIFDFCERAGNKIVNKKTIEALAKSGAFDSIHKNRKQIYDSCEILSNYTKSFEEAKNNPQMGLFDMFDKSEKIYPKLVNTDDWQGYDKFQKEFEAFGFYLANHPLDIMKNELEEKGISFLNEIMNNDIINDGAIIKLAGVVISTSIKSSDKGRYAFITLSDPTGLAELSLFNNEIIIQHKDWLDDKEHKQLIIECNVLKKEDTEPRFIIRELWLLDDYLRNTEKGVEKIRYIKKRDFSSFNFKKKSGSINNSIMENFKEEKSIEKVNIYINSTLAIKKLQEILLKCKKNNDKFTEIFLIINEKNIQLPNDYLITISKYNDIKNIDGIEKINTI